MGPCLYCDLFCFCSFMYLELVILVGSALDLGLFYYNLVFLIISLYSWSCFLSLSSRLKADCFIDFYACRLFLEACGFCALAGSISYELISKDFFADPFSNIIVFFLAEVFNSVALARFFSIEPLFII